ncbi:hypothetical protein HGM15179_020761, partial [Zosterops borbonicus]
GQIENGKLPYGVPQNNSQATKGQGGSSHIAEMKVVQLALDITERQRWPALYLYINSWIMRGPGLAQGGYNLLTPLVTVTISQILDWQHKSELFLAQWAHDGSGNQGRAATYRWTHDQGVNLTMDTISQVIHRCETCSVIQQAKRVKPPCLFSGQCDVALGLVELHEDSMGLHLKPVKVLLGGIPSLKLISCTTHLGVI